MKSKLALSILAFVFLGCSRTYTAPVEMINTGEPPGKVEILIEESKKTEAVVIEDKAGNKVAVPKEKLSGSMPVYCHQCVIYYIQPYVPKSTDAGLDASLPLIGR
jgi:hypothetical protein